MQEIVSVKFCTDIQRLYPKTVKSCDVKRRRLLQDVFFSLSCGAPPTTKKVDSENGMLDYDEPK